MLALGITCPWWTLYFIWPVLTRIQIEVISYLFGIFLWVNLWAMKLCNFVLLLYYLLVWAELVLAYGLWHGSEHACGWCWSSYCCGLVQGCGFGIFASVLVLLIWDEMVWLLVLFFDGGLLSTHAIHFLAAAILLSCCIALCDVYLQSLDCARSKWYVPILICTTTASLPKFFCLCWFTWLCQNLNHMILEQVSKFKTGSNINLVMPKA